MNLNPNVTYIVSQEQEGDISRLLNSMKTQVVVVAVNIVQQKVSFTSPFVGNSWVVDLHVVEYIASVVVGDEELDKHFNIILSSYYKEEMATMRASDPIQSGDLTYAFPEDERVEPIYHWDVYIVITHSDGESQNFDFKAQTADEAIEALEYARSMNVGSTVDITLTYLG